MEMNIHNINIDDKFLTVKKMWFLDEGTVITVTDVGTDGIVSFTFGENNTNNGYMDIATFREHFKKVEDMTAEVTVPEITDEYIADIMDNSEFETHTSFGKCTIVACRLPNGFVITESTACVNPENYDEELAEEICLDKIAEKIRELEAYRLQQNLWEKEFGCPCCCGECDECQYDDEFDECLDTDLDCDDCEEYDCPYNTNR